MGAPGALPWSEAFATAGANGERNFVTLERTLNWIVGLVVALALVTQAVLYFNAGAARVAERAVQHTQDVQNAIQRFLSALQDVETAYRGYVITIDDALLEPLATGRGVGGVQLERLRALNPDNPETQERLQRLGDLMHQELTYADEIVSLRRNSGFDVVQARIRQGEGQQIMNGIREQTTAMLQAESSMLTARRMAAARQSRLTTYTAVAAVAVLLAALGTFLWGIREQTAARATITENLRQSEESLRDLLQQIERSNRDLQDFAMVASHDLQEPLRKIQMFGDRLRDEYSATLPAQGLDYLRRMENAADRGQLLIQGLLAYSRVTTKAQPPIPVALGEVAEEVVSDLEASLAQTGGRVEVGPLPTLDADPLQMRQLLQNLIGNALKFHKPNVAPMIRVDARETGETDTNGVELWQISVADNGIGFDEKYLDRIFKIFQRLHERHVYEGAGMGLAICRRIVERHGGTITARSILGEGSTFIITIPSRKSAALENLA
jgi:light-regulated signal transduction histidine kinase (bacteriophytochrome)